MQQAILLSPLLGALICGLFWRLLGQVAAQWLAIGLVAISTLLCVLIYVGFNGATQTVFLADWVRSGTLDMAWTFRVDSLSAPMIVAVSGITTLILSYSVSFMRWDAVLAGEPPYRPRFCSFLALQSFAMLLLLVADDLGQLAVGWGLLNVTGYLLTSFYFKKPSVVQAGTKVFVTNRIADTLLLLALVICFSVTDSMRFDDIFAVLSERNDKSMIFLGMEWRAVNLLSVLLVLAASVRAGQVLFHTWVSDASEAPLPAVAMITALTTTVAAVFVLLRMSPVLAFSPESLMILKFIGATTMIFAALVACVQTNIHRILVFASLAQLGFVLTIIGLGFFKLALVALLAFVIFQTMLFLAAGLVTKSANDECDLARLGGLRRSLPMSCVLMNFAVLGSLGVGVPFSDIGLTGFVAKNHAIVASSGQPLFWLFLLATFLFSLFSWRLVFLVFWGSYRGEETEQNSISEPAWLMRTCVLVLALAVLLSGVGPGGAILSDTAEWVGKSENHNAHLITNEGATTWSSLALMLVSLAGFFAALWAYIIQPDLPSRLAKSFAPVHRFLLQAGHFSALYKRIFVDPVNAMGDAIAEKAEAGVIDRIVNNTGTSAVPKLHRLAGRLQSGYLATYVVTMLVGLAILITWVGVIGWVN
ncbi:MAG: proton-conducting transporter membrane subunit [Pseudomonadota bacterium]